MINESDIYYCGSLLPWALWVDANRHRVDANGHKVISAETIAEANRVMAVQGETYDVLCEAEEVAPAPGGAVMITPAQQLVLAKLCEGKANKTIAYELGLSPETVKVHVWHMMKKLGVTNRVQLVLKTIEREPIIWAS